MPCYAIKMLQLLPRLRCAPLLELASSGDHVKQIHAQMVTNALLQDNCNVAKLMEKYFAEAWEGGTKYAQLLFRQVEEKAKVSFLWSIILKYTTPEESLQLFSNEMVKMHHTTRPDGACYTYILRSCVQLRAIREGKQVHAQLLKDGLDSCLALATTCVHFYAVCQDFDAARRLFNDMPEKSSVSWNAMLSGYCINGLAKEVLSLFKEMLHSEARPTDRTTILLLSACSQIGNLALGTSIHSHALKTIPDCLACPFIGTGLVDMYSKCGSLGNASELFHAMSRKNVITWSTMAAALAIHGHGKEVIEFIDLMEKEGIAPNAITFTSMLSACCHSGLVEVGLHLFDEMQNRYNILPRMQHYGCIVNLLGRSGMILEAHEFIKKMPLKPDAVVWRAMLSACKIHGESKLGREIGKFLINMKQLPKELLIDSEDFIALSNVYALAEMWEDVYEIRTSMKKKRFQNKPGGSSVHNIQTGYKKQSGIHT